MDLTVSLRRLRRSPGFTITAIVTLALGIGANTAIFTAVKAVLSSPSQVERPKELVFLNLRNFKTELPTQSYPNYLDLRDRNDVLAGLSAFRPAALSFSRGAAASNARVWVYEVTGNYFDVLGVNPLLGRVLHAEDDRTRGGHPIAVLSYASWQRRFGADPDVAGKVLKLNGLNYTVAGVTPKGFSGTESIFSPEIFVPMAMEPQLEPGNNFLDSRSSDNIFCVGRLKPGVTPARAEAALNAITTILGREHPEANAGMKLVLSPPGLFGSMVRGPVEGFAAVLMSVTGLVLLLACVNLAGLLLARASDRRKETAVRLALGAGRGHLVRQLLAESMILSLAGGAAGLLLASWLTDLFAAWQPPIDVPVIPVLTIDASVIGFAAMVSIATGLLFGLAPALQSTRGLGSALKNEALMDRLRGWHLRDMLVARQVALSVVLLVGSILVVRSLKNALSLNLGFDPRNAVTVSLDLSLQGYDVPRGHEFQHRLIQKVRATPGIQSAGLISFLPLTLYAMNNNTVYVEGRPALRVADLPLAASYWMGPGYLAAARTKLVAGRDFDDRDHWTAPRVAIVNEAFARQILSGENPIGKRFRSSPAGGEWTRIVGVVEDGKYRSLLENPVPVVFTPMEQFAGLATTVVARSPLPAREVAPMLRRAVQELDSSVSTYEAGTVTDHLGLALLPARLAATVLSAFGVLALALAATGVYGIVAYSVARRMREIGIRMALGAAPAQVLRSVLRRTAQLLLIGSVAGFGLALAAGRFFSLILYGVNPADPLTYAVAFGLMAGIAFAACWVPARRAIHVDPVTALRME